MCSLSDYLRRIYCCNRNRYRSNNPCDIDPFWPPFVVPDCRDHHHHHRDRDRDRNR